MKTITTSSILGLLLFCISCGPNQRILESANENQSNSTEPAAITTNAAPAASSFEQDLNAMRTADFKFIVVLRRKDGHALDAGDKASIAAQASQANRRKLSDEGKAVIIGSNFPFITGTFDGLKERFNLENYSKPDSGEMFSNTMPNK